MTHEPAHAASTEKDADTVGDLTPEEMSAVELDSRYQRLLDAARRWQWAA